MGLFRRSNKDSQKQRQQSQSQQRQHSQESKAWAVLRLFQSGKHESTAAKATVSAAAAAAAATGEYAKPAASKRQQPSDSLAAEAAPAQVSAAAAACFGDESSPGCQRIFSSNQNFTPQVSGSPESMRLLPTSHPFLRNASVPVARHNAGEVSADARARELAKYDLWQRRHPRFHFGPRNIAAGDDEDETGGGGGGGGGTGGGGGGGRRGSGSASSASTPADNLIALPPKYAFIYQDGKFVEREVNRWPKPKRERPHTRYRVQEPYASHYGRRYRRRVDAEEHIVSLRHRLIYQNPIYRLPRRIMEENKSRLMIRHSLKDSFENGKPTCAPQRVVIGEREQSKMIKRLQEKANQKEAEKLVNYMSKSKKGKDSKA